LKGNSAQRRKKKRIFFRENSEEIQKLIDWINGPEEFEFSHVLGDGEIVMVRSRIEAFGDSYPRLQSGWKEYLIKRGVDPAKFIDLDESSEIPKLPDESSEFPKLSCKS